LRLCPSAPFYSNPLCKSPKKVACRRFGLLTDVTSCTALPHKAIKKTTGKKAISDIQGRLIFRSKREVRFQDLYSRFVLVFVEPNPVDDTVAANLEGWPMSSGQSCILSWYVGDKAGRKLEDHSEQKDELISINMSWALWFLEVVQITRCHNEHCQNKFP